MDGDSEKTVGPADSGHHDSAIETVAKTIGAAAGVIAATAAKALGSTPPPAATKPQGKVGKAAGRKAAKGGDGEDKRAEQRKALKNKKRKAHKVKLKRSHTKG